MTTEETEPTNDAEVTAELAKPENIEAYVAERREQEAEDQPKDGDEADLSEVTKDLREKYGLEDKKKASRNERRRLAREALERENETLRQQLGQRSEPSNETHPKLDPRSGADLGAVENSLKLAADRHGDEKFGEAFNAFQEYVQRTGDKATYDKVVSAPDIGEALVTWHEQGGATQAPQQALDPYQEALEQGRQDVRFQQALAEREAEIRLQTEVNFRAAEFAKVYPDYQEAIESIKDINTVPGLMVDLIMRSEFGPAIAYMLAKDAFEGNGTIFNLADLANDPIAQARLVGSWEQAVRNGYLKSSAPQRVTTAPPPIRPVQGGASGPKDLMTLAKDDSVDAYVKARRSNG